MPHYSSMESVDLGDSLWECLVPVKIRFVRELRQTALAGHGIDVLALRLDLGLLVVWQSQEALEDGFRLHFSQLVEGDLLQDGVFLLEITG